MQLTEALGDAKLGAHTAPGRGLLLGVLDPESYGRLAQAGRLRAFQSGAVLMSQGEPADEMYAIVSGRVRVERSHHAIVRPLLLATLGPGDIVGEMGIVLDAPRSATVRALTDVVAIGVSREATLRTFSEVPGLPATLQRMIARRLAENDELVAQRIARYVARVWEGAPA